MNNTNDPVISVVIPIFNEEETLNELHQRLEATLTAQGKSYEIIFVNDGSHDKSPQILQALHADHASVRVLNLSKNYGQSPALYAGLSAVRGEYIVLLDADLQNFPEDIPLIVEKLEEGYDAVSGWRMGRQDTFFRRFFSKLLNLYIARCTKSNLHDCGCALKGFRRGIVDHMNQLSHRVRYLPADAAWLGGTVAEVKVRHEAREKGQSKYDFTKLVRTAWDLLTGITTAPLQAIGIVGWVFACGGFLVGLRVLIRRILYGDILQLESVIAVFFALAGVQLIATGLMCSYVGRIFIEVQRKPYYIIKEELKK